jgi:hypothetical protein
MPVTRDKNIIIIIVIIIIIIIITYVLEICIYKFNRFFMNVYTYTVFNREMVINVSRYNNLN